MNVTPMYDRLLIRKVEDTNLSSCGLYIPDEKDKPVRGTVLAVGQGKSNTDGSLRPMIVKPNDEILFGKFAAVDLKVDGETLYLLHEDDVLVILGK